MTEPSKPSRLTALYRRNHAMILVGALVLCFLVIFLSGQMFITIPAGAGGVMWWRFFGGTATSWHFSEGTRIIAPWDKVAIYDLRLQNVPMEVDALASDGLVVAIEVTAQFRLNPATLGLLHKNVGPDYVRTLVEPQLSSHIREIVAKQTVGALYSLGRAVLQKEIMQSTESSLGLVDDDNPNSAAYINIEDVVIREVKLPDSVAEAIRAKDVALHNAQQYDYLLIQERKESVRKVIEALGIKAFQDIVSSGITDSYLRWKGIDATLKLAQSDNAKMVIIGSGPDGLPVILGNWAEQSTPDHVPPPAQAPTDQSQLNQSPDALGAVVDPATLDKLSGAFDASLVQEVTGAIDRATSSAADRLNAVTGTLEDRLNNPDSDRTQ